MTDQYEFSWTDHPTEESPVTDSTDTATTDTPEDFQTAMDRLRTLAEDLERGDLSLEEAMEHYEEGLALIQFCEDRLEEAELLVEQVDDADSENPQTESLEVPDS